MTILLIAAVAAAVFGAIVLVHEAGHFLAARSCGIHVEEFSIGFGPAVWRREKNGTVFSLRLLPLGGFNNLSGEYAQEDGEEDEENAAAGKPEQPDAAPRRYDPNRPLFPAALDGRDFSEASPWQRFFVIAAGALMNFLLGFVLLLILTASEDAVTSRVIYDFTDENARSQATGLQAGDEILKVNGHLCFTIEDMLYELQRTSNYTVSMTVLRDGALVTLPAVQFDTAAAEDGTVSMVVDFRVRGVQKTPRSVVRGAVRYFCYYARAILRSFLDLLSGRLPLTELSGPVGVVSAVRQAVEYGWKDVLALAAVLTINLGIFNLLPIPGLDGGRLLFLAAEGITRRELPQRFEMAINAVGMVLLLILMLMTTVQDVARIMG